jgi:hypothetical protein
MKKLMTIGEAAKVLGCLAGLGSGVHPGCARSVGHRRTIARIR